MLDRLGALVDKSLVVVEGEGAPRYRLLESARGELAQAEAAIRSGRALMVRGLGTAFALMMSLSLLAQRREKPELAARLFGCAEQAYSAGGHHMHPPEVRIRERVLGALRARFSEEEIATLLAEGARWSEEEAFERAGL